MDKEARDHIISLITGQLEQLDSLLDHRDLTGDDRIYVPELQPASPMSTSPTVREYRAALRRGREWLRNQNQ